MTEQDHRDTQLNIASMTSDIIIALINAGLLQSDYVEAKIGGVHAAFSRAIRNQERPKEALDE